LMFGVAAFFSGWTANDWQRKNVQLKRNHQSSPAWRYKGLAHYRSVGPLFPKDRTRNGEFAPVVK
jgi:hypothetical protein